jgi:hypothetical protein
MNGATSSVRVTSPSRPARSLPTSAVLLLLPMPTQAVDQDHDFVVGYRDEYLPAIDEARVALFGDHKPADTLVGVEALSRPGYLIEVEALAVIDD